MFLYTRVVAKFPLCLESISLSILDKENRWIKFAKYYLNQFNRLKFNMNNIEMYISLRKNPLFTAIQLKLYGFFVWCILASSNILFWVTSRNLSFKFDRPIIYRTDKYTDEPDKSSRRVLSFNT